MTPMTAPAITEATTQFTDPAIRARVLKMHGQEMPFLAMAAELGIVFDGALRDAIARLTADEVAIIRKAMVAAINRDDPRMPVDCEIVELPAKIAVAAVDIDGVPWAQVTAGK
jgi:hypothetical protein